MRQIIYSPEYRNYNLGDSHPFSPLRIEMLYDLIMDLGIEDNFIRANAVSRELLYEIHSKEYVDLVEKASKGIKDEHYGSIGLGTSDNPIVEGMADAARLLCGGALKGAELIIQDQADKVLQFGGGFHHAHYNSAAGFCLYNDLAVAINHFVKQGKHVLYLDIDVHHGDGVQELFYNNDKVMTVSLHESGEYLFPGTGWIHELGHGMGKSLSLNLPLEPFTEGESYLSVFNSLMDEAMSYYRPDVMVVQAGADAHFSDPLADLSLTTHDFQKLFENIFELADKYSNGKTLFTLGGGYSPTATLRIWGILALIFLKAEIPEKLPESFTSKWEPIIGKKFPETFHDIIPAYDEIPRREIISRQNKQLLERLLDSVSPDWL